MSSQSIPRTPARRARRPPWPQLPTAAAGGPGAPRTVPFIPENPRSRRRRPVTASELPDVDEPPVPAAKDPTPGRHAKSRSASAGPRAPRVRRRLKPGGLYRWIRRFRIPLAVVLGLVAVLAALLAREHAGAQTATAIRATSDLAAGEVLSTAVMEEVEIDAAAVPAGHSADLDALLGETVAVALPAGALVHHTQLVGPGLLAGYAPGTVAVPVRPSDTALIGLLSPGQMVDVTASSDAPEHSGGAAQIAEAAPVLWVPQDESENWLGAASEARNVVILAVDATTAERLAEASHSGQLHLTLVGEDS